MSIIVPWVGGKGRYGQTWHRQGQFQNTLTFTQLMLFLQQHLLPDSGHSTYSFISTFAKDILSVLECYRP